MKNKIKKYFKNIEFWLLTKLLKRYSNNYLDQWDRWKVQSDYGNVYITISRDKEGNNESNFINL